MIQIISGKYKGRKLKQVPDKYVRPTQAVVRKSILQILEPFTNLNVLDLYAGVGTLGIEALSRGASSLTMVEKNKLVFRVLEENINMIGAGSVVRLECKDVDFFLKNENDTYDVIFADPPYSMSNHEDLRGKVKCLLNPNGVFCMEMKKTSINNEGVRLKTFGNKQVAIWRK